LAQTFLAKVKRAFTPLRKAGVGEDAGLAQAVPQPSNPPQPACLSRTGQVAEHTFHVRLEGGFRLRFLATTVVQFARVPAQFFDRQHTQPDADE
jgi:hypothetical protein